MKTRLWYALFLTLLLHSPSAEASEFCQPRVRFYSEPGFRGECLEITSDTELYNLAYTRDRHGRKWDDRIESVLIDGPVTVTLYADPRYRGDRIELCRSEANLARLRHVGGEEGWDHRVSSLRAHIEWGNPGYGHEQEFHNPREAERAVNQAFRDILGRQPDQEGLRHYTQKLLREGWSEEQLRRDLRDSREFHNRDYEAIVRKCYRDVLHREPDAAGLRSYCRNLKEKGWTEEDLRRELRRSEENREKRATDIVTKAYKDILGRSPDEAGLRNYRNKVMNGMSENELRDILRGSSEYRNRPKH